MKKMTELVLERIPCDIFTDADLVGLLEGTSDRRYGLVKRAIAGGDILRIRRGLYCLAPKHRRKGMNLYALAQQIYGPSYVSLESALSYHGWIPEAIYCVTNISIKKSNDFTTPLGEFIYRRIPLSPFYEEVDRIKTADGAVFFMARPFKALVDYLYIYRKNWTGMRPAAEDLRINPEYLNAITARDCAALRNSLSSRRVHRFISGVEKELGR